MIRWALFMVKSCLAAIIVLATIFTLWTIGPSIETARLPVVGKLEVLSVVENADHHTVIRAAFRKLRECEYIGIQWFKIEDGGQSFERVPVELLREDNDTSSPNRPVGYQKAGPWIVHVSLAEFKERSFATLTHRCHPFWSTTTNFYP
jgi:hypothetical protein